MTEFPDLACESYGIKRESDWFQTVLTEIAYTIIYRGGTGIPAKLIKAAAGCKLVSLVYKRADCDGGAESQ